MSNMSYCRFENTERDLQDCWQNWELDEASSNYEIRAKIRMIKLIKEMIENIGDEEIEELRERLQNQEESK